MLKDFEDLRFSYEGDVLQALRSRFGEIPLLDHRQARQFLVITSYSIHYTKLYDFTEFPGNPGIKNDADADRFATVTASELVITSYSIHYTKLYEEYF